MEDDKNNNQKEFFEEHLVGDTDFGLFPNGSTAKG